MLMVFGAEILSKKAVFFVASGALHTFAFEVRLGEKHRTQVDNAHVRLIHKLLIEPCLSLPIDLFRRIQHP